MVDMIVIVEIVCCVVEKKYVWWIRYLERNRRLELDKALNVVADFF